MAIFTSSSARRDVSFTPSHLPSHRRHAQARVLAAHTKRVRAPKLSLSFHASTSASNLASKIAITPNPMAKVQLPRKLAHPAPTTARIHPDALLLLEPELVDVPLEYIRNRLLSSASEMLTANAHTQISHAPRRRTGLHLPKSLPVSLSLPTAHRPTHLLAIPSTNAPSPLAPHRHNTPSDTTAVRTINLYPAHALVLLSSCAYLPPFPLHSAASKPDGETAETPIIPLPVPSPATFPILHTYLYTRSVSSLLPSLLPPLSPSASSSLESIFCATPDPNACRALAVSLAASHTLSALLSYALAIHGVWANACALGVDFDFAPSGDVIGLGRTLDVAWEVVLGAMKVQQAQAA